MNPICYYFVSYFFRQLVDVLDDEKVYIDEKNTWTILDERDLNVSWRWRTIKKQSSNK